MSGAAAAALWSAGAYAPAALAQDDETAAPEERIVVTGSRIQRRDFEANSPIVTVDSNAFESQNGLNVESYLNKLPQFNPAAAPTVNGLLEGSNSDVQISAVRSVGVATVSLRGLGANRNLVLIDGHRPTPINALMVADTNAIPSALIDRVEIITGGASAVYGADAVGGVVNFIMKDDFTGLELDTQYGMTEAGDGEEFRISAVGGTDFADDRGNVSIGIEHYSRSVAYERNREFFTDSWDDPYIAGDLFVYGYNGWNPVSNVPSVNAVNAIFAGREPGSNIYARGPGGPGTSGTFSNMRFNSDGTVFNLARGNYRFEGDVDGDPYGYFNVYDQNRVQTDPVLVQNLKWNDRDALVGSPQTRYSTYGSLSYDITPELEFFARSTFAQSKTSTLLYPPPVSFGWEASVPYVPLYDSPVNPALDYTNASVVNSVLANPSAFANPNFRPTGTAGAQHPVPVELAILLNSRPAPNASNVYCLRGAPGCVASATLTPTNVAALAGLPNPNTGRLAPWVVELFPETSSDRRVTTNTNEVWQIETGLNGQLPFKDWTWQAYVSHGESSTYTTISGNRSLERWRELVAKPDYARGQTLIVGNEDGASPNFGGGIVSCTSGWYDTIFSGDVRPSDDCTFAVSATLQTRTQVQQNIAELNLEGALFDLPAGELRAAVGMQYRENDAQFYPDILESTASFADQVVGIYPTAYLDASTHVQDFYGEAFVPVLANLPLIQEFNLELGARYSDYTETGEAWTYKILGDWTVTDWLRLRGGYNRASRAPNLGELFLNLQQIFVQGDTPAFGDPCSARSNAPWGASGGSAPDPVITAGEGATVLAPGQTVAGANSTYLICQAQMTPSARAEFYGVTNATVAGGPSNWIYQQGNPDLTSEVADTWTFGAVLSSPFENPWLEGLSGSVDWYQLQIDDAIQQYSLDYARYLCYGTVVATSAAEASAQAATPECTNVGRNNALGGPLSVLVEYDNQATIETSGIDIAVNWRAQFEDLGVGMVPGGFGLNVQASILDYYRTKASDLPFDPEIEWKGSLGPNLAGTNPGAYDYKVFTTLSYFLGDASASLRWRYLPDVYPAAYAKQLAIYEQNQAVAAGAEGRILAFNPVDGVGGLLSTVQAKEYNIFDLSGNWQVNDLVSLRLGVDNLFDANPIRVGANTGFMYDPSLTFAQNEARRVALCDGFGGAPAGAGAAGPLGCVNPSGATNYTLPQNANVAGTAGGYYDTLGRRFFVGLKLTY